MSNINLSEASVEIRERRLGSVTGWEGTAADLIGCSHCGQLKETKRAFSQSLGCNSCQAFCQLSMVQDVAVVNHAPVGCAGDFMDFNFTYRIEQQRRDLDPMYGRYFNTNIEEHDTIFGAVHKLEATVREAWNRVHPKAIFVTTSCASGIIGEDIETLLDSLSEEFGIPVVSAPCEGFRSRIWTTGFDAAYHAILRKVVKAPEKKSNKVNIVNFWGSHVFDDFLESLGYEAQYVVPFATVEELEKISEAAVTIHICPTLSTYMGAGLDQIHGVPEIKLPPAYGVKGTDRWMREIGRVLDREKEVEAYIAKAHETIVPQIEAYREKFRGKTAFVTAGAAHGQAIIALLGELGFHVTSAAVYHHDPLYDNGTDKTDLLAQDVELYGDIKEYRVCNKQAFEIVNQLKRAQPDIMVARHTGMTIWGAKLGIPTLLIGDEQFGLGYEGTLKYAERLEDTLDAIEFISNYSKHSTNPYTDWWLEQEPGYFMGGKK